MDEQSQRERVLAALSQMYPSRYASIGLTPVPGPPEPNDPALERAVRAALGETADYTIAPTPMPSPRDQRFINDQNLPGVLQTLGETKEPTYAGGGAAKVAYDSDQRSAFVNALLRNYSDPAIQPSGYLQGQGLPSLPPLEQGQQPSHVLETMGKTRQGIVDMALRLAQGLYGKATGPSPTVYANRYEATFGADPNLSWSDYHDQLMRNFMDRARSSIPGLNHGAAAYNSYYDPEHPITQEKQDTKDAAINALMAGAEVGMPWMARNYAATMTRPPAQSMHPNQLGENIYASFPSMLPAWYGVKPTSPFPPTNTFISRRTSGDLLDSNPGAFTTGTNRASDLILGEVRPNPSRATPYRNTGNENYEPTSGYDRALIEQRLRKLREDESR